MGKIKDYIAQRTIRNESRPVEITVYEENGKRKESIKLLDAKRPRTLGQHLNREEAREIQKERSQRAKTLDSKKTSKVTTTYRWKANPGEFDYPEVDTKGQGAAAGKGYAWKADKGKGKKK